MTMRSLILLLLVIAQCWSEVRINIDPRGNFDIIVANRLWLRSARTAIYADDRWYSSDENSLPLLNISTAQGTDPFLGLWNETQLNYNLVRPQGSTLVVGRIRQWSIVSAFTFHLDVGSHDLTNTIALDLEEVRTVFPSFHIEQIDSNDQRGYFTFGGEYFLSLSSFLQSLIVRFHVHSRPYEWQYG
jgi:hypothetical protein